MGQASKSCRKTGKRGDRKVKGELKGWMLCLSQEVHIFALTEILAHTSVGGYH